jgi:hypothetical protein
MIFRDRARDAARLILGPIWHRVWARIENRLKPIEQRIERVEQLDAAWNQHVPAFLNAVATVGAFGHELAALRRQVAALEAPTSRRDDVTAAPLRPVSQAARLALSEAHPRLNLACGQRPLVGYLNVDRLDLPKVDIVADVDDLPVAAGSIAEIYSAHLLEQFPPATLRRLLPYWLGLLRPTGRFRAIVPDGSAMLAGLADGSYSLDDFRVALFGSAERADDLPRTLLTPNDLAALLAEAGFVEVEIPARARRNGRCFEFEIVGRKPGGEPARAAAND